MSTPEGTGPAVRPYVRPPRGPGTIGWFIATSHQLLGHDKAAALLGVPPGRKAGCKMSTGTVYVILARLERAGLAASSWEDRSDPGEPRDPGAPRRYWDLTPEGRELTGRLP